MHLEANPELCNLVKSVASPWKRNFDAKWIHWRGLTNRERERGRQIGRTACQQSGMPVKQMESLFELAE